MFPKISVLLNWLNSSMNWMTNVKQLDIDRMEVPHQVLTQRRLNFYHPFIGMAS